MIRVDSDAGRPDAPTQGGGQETQQWDEGKRTGREQEDETHGAGAARALTERRLGQQHIKKVSQKPHTCEPSYICFHYLCYHTVVSFNRQ